ncbi:MAG: glycoside hydrolase family 88 protein [Verrucomicrobiales bacterium]|nr:glycoside hydrolase family 88 protein [Verrucomicrobiales bacterium]
MHQFGIYLCSAILLTCASGNTKDWHVHPEQGSDDNDGSQSAPLKTAQVAINRAGTDDRILLFPANALYRQSITLKSPKSGIVIEGNGVTLTGADPLPENQWEALGDDLHRIRLPRTRWDRHLLIVNGTAQRMGRLCANPIDFPATEDLKEGEFRWDLIDEEEGWLTYRGSIEGLEWSTRGNGLATSGDHGNIKVFDLNTRHFLNDGFNIHGNARGIQFFNITGIENFDEGFSAHDSSTCWIRGGKFLRNEHAVADVNRADTYYTDCLFGQSVSVEVLFQGGRHSLTDCRIEPSADSLPISIRGNEENSASLVLRRVSVETSALRQKKWSVGAGVTVFIDHETLKATSDLTLDKHPSSRITEELYRTFPIGRHPDGSPLMAWVGGGTGNPRSSSYRIIHFDKHDPNEIAAKISPENDWFGLLGPLPELNYPPAARENDPQTETARAIWTWIGLCAPNSVFVPDNPGGRSLAEALRSHPPAGVGIVNVFLSEKTSEGETRTSVLSHLREDLPSASDAMNKRLRRSPEEIFAALASVYGNTFDGTYLDGLAIIARIRASKPHSGSELAESHLETPVSTNPGKLSANLLYTWIDEPWARERVQRAADQAFHESGEPREAMPGHNEMSDSIFMAGPLLAAAGRISGEDRYFDQCLKHVRFIQDLCQREDGLYRHSPINEAAWGRGNGFPALGLTKILDHLPEDHPGRAFVIESLHSHLEALAQYQNIDGLWHQMIDLTDTYPEFTASAMIAYCIARGINEERLDTSTWMPRLYSAWETIKTLISLDGSSFVNVCPGTGKQATLEDYYQRVPITGPDKRAGAMAMLLAQEMHTLQSRN